MKRKKKPAPDHERAELERQVKSLRLDIRKLQLEHDILKKANELVKKGTGTDPQLLSNREKTMLVDALKQTYPLPELLSVLRLARSSYFYHRARLLSLTGMLARVASSQTSSNAITAATAMVESARH